MDKRVFAFLKSYSSDTTKIDRLLVSAYVYSKDIRITHNLMLKNLLIKEVDSEYLYLQSFINIYKFTKLEDLIESFEFVISPLDKIVNGAVYTPNYIRKYIVEEAISLSLIEINKLKTCDLSCGCGGFLLTLTKFIRDKTKKSFFNIFKENIFGIDITDYSIIRSKILLSLLAVENGEDLAEYSFNLVIGNSLSFEWVKEFESIEINSGFDLIVGNPPYVTSRNMDETTLTLMNKWEVTQSGHPDLYIPFFQIGFENLNTNGILGFITVNTFLKSINGRSLRQYFSKNNVNLRIINFGGEQLFKDRNTYTCLCFLSSADGQVSYTRTLSDKIFKLTNNNFLTYNYSDLNDIDGWNLVSTHLLNDFVSSVELVGVPFRDLYITKNGIATLKNSVYKFSPSNEDEVYFYLTQNNITYAIERGICRDIINSNKLKEEVDLFLIREKIIFPYYYGENVLAIIPENIFIENYPRAYEYLSLNRRVLSNRDKGNREYETWYAYGRKQSMDINAFKLFFPHICNKPSFVISQERDLLFYNGIAVISNNLEELQVLKLILESDIFYNYIKNTTKDYSSGYISMSKNYLKNFGVYQLSLEEQTNLLASPDPNTFINMLYASNNPDILNYMQNLIDDFIEQ